MNKSQQLLRDFNMTQMDPMHIFQVNDIVGLVPGVSTDVLKDDGEINTKCFDENGYCMPSVIQNFFVPKPGVNGGILVSVLPLVNNERGTDPSWFIVVPYLSFGLIKRPGPNEIEMVYKWSRDTMHAPEHEMPARMLGLKGSLVKREQPTISMVTFGNQYDDDDDYSEEEEVNA